nr:TetR/AcrR family transcriptional regulator [Sphingobium sp. Sx8-8]
MFHEHGYDGTGVAALAQAMGINPPSLYAAFGDKASLFGQVLARYAASALPVGDLLSPGAPPAQALTRLLHEAARIYAADPSAAGCLVLEGARGSDPDAAARARIWKEGSASRIRDFLAPSHPEQAGTVADYMVAILSGLSSDARAGRPVERLLAVADMAGLALKVALPG